MADDTLIPLSPTWWLHRLIGKLQFDQPRLLLMDRYYRGNHPLPQVPKQLKDEFRTMLARSNSNFMRIVVDAPAERMRVQGFRAPGSEKADETAWSRWLDSHMDVDANLAITDTLALGRSYLSVWKFQNEDSARITVEDARTTLTENEPLNPHRRAAGLRLWRDDWTDLVRADVWLRDGCYQFQGLQKVMPSLLWPQSWSPAYPIDATNVTYTDLVLREEPADTVQWAQQWTELDRIPNPTGEIPLIPIVNRPSVLKRPDGESELDDVYLTQDRINEMLFNRALAAWTTAYRQKWATGLEVPVDEHGNEVEPYQAAIDRLWVSESTDTKFGEFGASDLKPYIDSVEQDVQHIAVQTRTPRHYFLQAGQAPSGDAIKSAETGLVAKVTGDKMPIVGRAFAEAQRLAQLMDGQDSKPLEVIWADPEYRTLAELTDAVLKQLAAGVIPKKIAREKIGYSQSEIRRMETIDLQQALLEDAVEDEAADEPPVEPEPALA